MKAEYRCLMPAPYKTKILLQRIIPLIVIVGRVVWLITSESTSLFKKIPWNAKVLNVRPNHVAVVVGSRTRCAFVRVTVSGPLTVVYEVESPGKTRPGSLGPEKSSRASLNLVHTASSSHGGRLSDICLHIFGLPGFPRSINIGRL